MPPTLNLSEAAIPHSTSDPSLDLRVVDGSAAASDFGSNLRRHLAKGAARLVGLVIVDVLTVAATLSLLVSVRGGMLGTRAAAFATAFLPAASLHIMPVATAVVIGMLMTGAYRAGDRWRDPARTVTAVAIGVLLIFFDDLWSTPLLHTALSGGLVWAGVGIALGSVRSGVGAAVSRLPKQGLPHRTIEIRGSGGPETPLRLGPGYRTVASMTPEELPADIEEMESWLLRGVDTLVVTGKMDQNDFGRLADFAVAHGCRLLCMPRARELEGVEPKRIWIAGQPFSEINTPGLRASQLLIKRFVDIVGAGTLLLVLSPLLLFLAALVKLGSHGPVFFKHRRAGYRGEFFRLIKFRSMRADAEDVLRNDSDLYRKYLENDFKLPESEDPRVTRLGRFLRKTSLDELPQLINVVRGDMSLVGPRPVVEEELMMYRGRIPTFLSVKPGVTGFWQISGRSHIGFPERAELDLAYVRNWSLARDFLILLMTIPAVLKQRGAH